ncbi:MULTISPECIES: LysR family transcriptional regulator [Marinomonas]|uniref:DNA-binding transcriptional regulator, LysR family n=2 Tax=Marinomonas TaxID=28253 RepID=A0A1M5MX02_9GAMM|nr:MULTISPECIES: LysR family transcriptional regulator [Marinomonas]RCW98282.1 DNA-binding transcriptional LysR family regulator [Marinomonas foliarum]SHG81828.1 DNA-binding transcriptional regulator, LysR family [Marinomonas polaris DSM 16579]|tara:strand:+ start:5632 stop:6846 length:1215 start_codon:yes stop_codon:yes gene_type:complete
MEINIPNLRHLRVFLAVAEFKSITRASERIFLSQPAITQAIAKLESVLGAALFERHSDGMYLTDSGEVWQKRVARAVDHIQQATQEIVKDTTIKERSPKNLIALISTTQLRALIAVSESQNFSIASRQLGVSQSSVHRAARDLERLLGVILFEKNSLGISTTKAAKTLSKATKLAFSELRQGIYEINALQFKDVSTITIGSMPLARMTILPKSILQFNERHPDVNINVTEGAYIDLLHHLRQGDIDIILGALRHPTPADDVVQEELWSPPLSIVGRKNHPLTKKAQICVQDLAQYAWVVPTKSTPTRQAFEALFQDVNVALPTRLVESSSQVLIRELLLESDRLTLISAHQVEREINIELLTVLDFPLEHTRRPIGLCVRKSWLPTVTQSHFLSVLRKISEHFR